MKTIILVVITVISFCELAIGQETKEPQNHIANKLVPFSANSGVMVVRGFTNIGKIKGHGTVSVDVRELRDARNPDKYERGVAIVVEGKRGLFGFGSDDSTSFVSYADIDSIITGLNYLAAIDSNITKMKNFEASYSIKDSFNATVFNDISSGEISVGVSNGKYSSRTAFLSLSDLKGLVSLISTAKQTLDSLK